MEEKNKHAIVFTVTTSHLNNTVVAIASLVKHFDSQKPVDIIIVLDGGVLYLEGDFIQSLPKRYGKENIKIFIFNPAQWTKDIEIKTRYPEITFQRIGLPTQFFEYEKILYLDNDVLIYQDVSSLFDQFNQSKLIGAVRDFSIAFASFFSNEQVNNFFHENTSAIINASHIDNYQYVNSGLLMFDVKKFNSLYNQEQLLNEINQRDLGNFPDQNFVNQFFENQIQHFDLKWNFQVRPQIPEGIKDQLTDQSQAFINEIEQQEKMMSIHHFVGVLKPSDMIPFFDQYDLDYFEMQREIKMMSF